MLSSKNNLFERFFMIYFIITLFLIIIFARIIKTLFVFLLIVGALYFCYHTYGDQIRNYENSIERKNQ